MLRLLVPQAELRSINYGHFGLPRYDPDLRRWTFSKLTSHSTRFLQLGPTSNAIEATGSFEKDVFLREVAEDKDSSYGLTLESELRLLVASFPELQPAEGIMKPLLRLSEGIARTLEDTDPAMTELVDVGAISCTNDGGRESYRLLATPGGECGQALRLTRLYHQGYRTDDDQHFELDLPTDETGWWAGKGAPILQMCFSCDAGKPAKNTLLAVRLQASIVFMFPRYRDLAVPASGELEHQFTHSRIDPNVLFELRADQAHGTRLADVSFNPWDRRQFVVIDLRGQWTIFKMVRADGDYPIYAPQPLQRGRMPKELQEEVSNEDDMLDDEPAPIDNPEAEPEEEEEEVVVSEEAETLPDWAVQSAMPRIKVSISRRASPVLSDISSIMTSKVESNDESSDQEMEGSKREESSEGSKDPGEEDEVPEIRQDGWLKAIWVLNMNTMILCSRRAIHVLNTSTNEYFNLPKLRMTETRSAGWFLDFKLCSGHTDHVFVLTSYSIFLVRIHEVEGMPNNVESTESKSVLKSRIIISALHFRDPADTTLRISVSIVDNGYLVTVFSRFNRIMTCFRVDMQPGEQVGMSEAMGLMGPEDAPERTLGLIINRVKMDEGLYDVRTSSSHNEKLYSVQFLGRDYGMRHSFFEARSIQDQTRPMTVPWQIRYVQETEVVKRKSSFAVPDKGIDDLRAEDEVQGNDEDDIPNENDASAQRAPKTILTTRSGTRGVDAKFYELSMVVVENLDLGKDQVVPRIGINEISAIIQTAVDKRNDEDAIPRTLFEHIEGAMPKVEDLRDASFELEDAVAASSEVATVRVYPQTIPLPRENGDEEDNYIPFDDMHTYIQDQYIMPLDQGFSETFREQRKWLAKSIAAEIMLSSARVEHNVKKEVKQDEHGTFVDSSLPISLSQDVINDEESSTLQEQRRSPYEAPLTAHVDAILDRLRRNVRLEVKPSQKWSLKGMVMLSHWDTSADPTNYDYAATTSRLEEEKELLGMSETERRKLQRKQDRIRQRREREARRTEQLTQQSSQAPTILSSQLPGIASHNMSTTMGSPAFAPSHQLGSSQMPPRSRQKQNPGFASQSKTSRSSQTHGFGSQPLSQVSRFGNQPSSNLGGQLPSFGSQGPAAPRPKSQRSVPGFGPAPPAPARSKTLPTLVSQFDSTKGKAVAESSKTQGQHQQFSFPFRSTAAPLPTPSQTAASQIIGASQASTLPALSQPIGTQLSFASGSQRPVGQLDSSQALRQKKKKRMEGF